MQKQVELSSWNVKTVQIKQLEKLHFVVFICWSQSICLDNGDIEWHEAWCGDEPDDNFDLFPM